MLADFPAMCFVGAADLDRAHTFYGGRLGLLVYHRDPMGVVYQLDGARLRVSLVPGHVPAGFTVLGWEVTDLPARVTELVAAGVVFERFPGMEQDPHGIWTAPGGARVAWFRDPDGNILSLSQSA